MFVFFLSGREPRRDVEGGALDRGRGKKKAGGGCRREEKGGFLSLFFLIQSTAQLMPLRERKKETERDEENGCSRSRSEEATTRRKKARSRFLFVGQSAWTKHSVRRTDLVHFARKILGKQFHVVYCDPYRVGLTTHRPCLRCCRTTPRGPSAPLLPPKCTRPAPPSLRPPSRHTSPSPVRCRPTCAPRPARGRSWTREAQRAS